MSQPLTFQDAILRLQRYWGEECPTRCLIWQPYNTEVGAGTMNPATYLRVLGPEPWNVGYVEPSVRPDDSRYGDNPNRLQMHTQYQVILKPDPGNPQELYLESLERLGIDRRRHDIRFVEDNWESPALGAWGLGWEVWLDGLEITQFTYFQQAGGFVLDPVSVEITYGLERIIMALQGARHFKEIIYARDNDGRDITYGEVLGQNEYEMSVYNLDAADVGRMNEMFDRCEAEAREMLARGLPIPAYNYVLKTSHAFNILDSRGAIGVTERARYFARMRDLARAVAQKWVEKREELGHPLGAAAMTAVSLPAIPETAASSRQTFILEIGSEELPPADVMSALDQLRARVPELLKELRLDHAAIRIDGAPRRLAVIVDALAPRQANLEQEVKGPPASVAFDKDGKPTKAALGFAKKAGVDPGALQTKKFDGGEYLVAVAREEGKSASAALAAALPRLIAGIQFAKSMRWNASNVAYSRPIRWIAALLGDHVIPFEYAGLASGDRTRGVRIGNDAYLSFRSADAYAAQLRSGGIIPSVDDRKSAIWHRAVELAASVNGTIPEQARTGGLLDEVANLVESPTPLLGSFEKEYLELPRDVLVTVMRKHQRYFPVEDAEGRLAPHFVAVANGPIDVDLVRAGNEAVLRARYADAAFFWKHDIAHTLEEFRPKLKGLTFQAKLGSMLDKSERIESMLPALANLLGLSAGEKAVALRAGRLAKADLATDMVVELTSLAGAMGREYALRAGEKPEVAQAIFEHALPRSAGDKLPQSKPGVAVALADRFDSLVGLFAIGLAPKATADPFALRRAALGIVQTLVERGIHLDMREAVHLAAAQQPVEVTPEAEREVLEFIVRRFEQWLLDQGERFDLTQAALSARGHDPARAIAALKELTEAAGQPSFAELLPAYARCARILRGQTAGGDVAASLFEKDSERELWNAVQRAEGQIGDNSGVAGFMAAFQPLVAPINQFFDDVMVMAEDEKVRANRLALVNRIASLADGIADFSKVEGF